MRKYLRELYKKSERHKRNFALLVSGGVTLLIFGVWSAVEFGGEENLAREVSQDESWDEITPFESLRDNIASSLEAIKGSARALKQSVENIDLELEYEEMRDNALENYE